MTSYRLPYTIPGGQQVQFTPYALRGRGGGDALIVGSGSLRSENYEAGTTGWRVDGQGNAEFQDGTFRGEIQATSGTFSGSLSSVTGSISGVTGTFSGDISAASGTFAGELGVGSGNTIFRVNSTGDMWIGHATELLAPFQVDNQGNLTANNGTFSGTVNGTATGVTITGSNVVTNDVANTISGNFVSGVSGWQITGDGNAEFNNITLRGTIYGDLYSGDLYEGNRVYISNDGTDGSINFGNVITGPNIRGDGFYFLELEGPRYDQSRERSTITLVRGVAQDGWILYAGKQHIFSAGTTDGSGQLQVPTGAAATPAVSFGSDEVTPDTNTGFYRQAENTVSFAGGGVEQFRMGDATGDFQIFVDPAVGSETWYTGWASYGGDYDVVLRKDVHGFVFLEGLAQNKTGVTATSSLYPNIILLPSGYRPLRRHVFMTDNNAGSVIRIDAQTNGAVTIVSFGAVANDGWISLSGMQFYAGW